MGQSGANMTNQMILMFVLFFMGYHSTSASSNNTHSTPDHANMDLPNCQTLDEGKLVVNYAVDKNEAMAIIEINSVIVANEYVAFGLSGSEIETQMIGSDVDVMSMDDDGISTITDYSLQSRAKCNREDGTGACPDTKVSDIAHDDVTLLDASNLNGIMRFRYQRPLAAQDPEYDQEIPTNRSVNVVWARGQRTDDGLISKHTARISADETIRINFAQDGTPPCAPLTPTASPKAGDHGTTITVSAMLMGFALVLNGIVY